MFLKEMVDHCDNYTPAYTGGYTVFVSKSYVHTSFKLEGIHAYNSFIKAFFMTITFHKRPFYTTKNTMIKQINPVKEKNK